MADASGCDVMEMLVDELDGQIVEDDFWGKAFCLSCGVNHAIGDCPGEELEAEPFPAYPFPPPPTPGNRSPRRIG